MLKGDRYIRKLMKDINNIKTIFVSKKECSFKVTYEYYKIEDRKSFESVVYFYNKYGYLVCSTELKFIYIKDNIINIY